MVDKYINREKIALLILEDIRKDNSFPYLELSENKIDKEYKKLCDSTYDNLPVRNNSCLDIVSHFHHSIYKCNVRNKPSMYDAFFDDELLFKCIMNRLLYKEKELNRRDIIQGFNVSKIAPKISIFKPSVAKYLIKKYLDNYDTVFDPCCGYSGRMLGCCSLNKRYIGQDINPITVAEANELKKELKLNAELKVSNSIKDSKNYDCLFTCPPYFDKENWNQEIEILSSEEWIDVLTHNFKCKRYLFIVDNPGKYSNNVVEEIHNKSHFSNNKEFTILINSES